MKFLIFVLVLVITANAYQDELGKKFQDFKLMYSKTYRNQAEETKRFVIFRNNLQSFEEHNALFDQGLESYKKGVNQFADLTKEEFKALLTLRSSQRPNLNVTNYIKSGLAVPDFIDWRTKGQITGVKVQGTCGSCYAFSLTGTIEAAYYRKSGKLVSFSEQQLVDCTRDINYGCIGGFLDKTFPYIETNGLETEADYPYTGSDDTCKFSASKVITKISGYIAITPGDEDALLDAVANIGPIAASLDTSELSSYASGIHESKSCMPFLRNHGVLLVGYGIENGKKYWIAKNSWGVGWGEQGYFRILRGVNECGIAENTVYPIIN